jgi:hypothetical protein
MIEEAMSRAVVIIVGVLLSAAAVASLAGQRQAPLVIAYVVSDGELVPIARYDGAAWQNTWPAPIAHDAPLPVRRVDEIPTAWLGQPVPLMWTAWSQATEKQQRVTVTGVDRDGSCFQAITLDTSFKSDLLSDGLAFNRPTTVDAIVDVEQRSSGWGAFRREMAPHFRTAITRAVRSQPGGEQSEPGAKLLALARADKFADETVVVQTVFRDPRFPVLFIEAQRHFGGIAADIDDDALSYRGWFRRNRAGALIPISASVASFSTAEGRLPRYSPVGILRLGSGSIWVMSEWGIESQTIVLFDVSAKGVRKLISADVSGC